MSQAQDISSKHISFPNEEVVYWYGGKEYPPSRRLLSPNMPITVTDLANARKSNEFYCKLFDMTNEEDLVDYKSVKDRVLDGWCRIVKEETKWNDKNTGVLIWLEWVQTYSEI